MDMFDLFRAHRLRRTPDWKRELLRNLHGN
jgi:hypothetical protein